MASRVRRTDLTLLALATMAAAPLLLMGHALLWSDLLSWLGGRPGAAGSAPLTGNIARIEWTVLGGTVGLVGLWICVLRPAEHLSRGSAIWLSVALAAGAAAALDRIFYIGLTRLLAPSWEGLVWPIALLVPLYLAARHLPHLARRVAAG